jgi:hypothetical protein
MTGLLSRGCALAGFVAGHGSPATLETRLVRWADPEVSDTGDVGVGSRPAPGDSEPPGFDPENGGRTG